MPTGNAKKWLLLLVCIFSQLVTAMQYALHAPFYPSEAVSKSMTPSQIGVVFAIYSLIQCAGNILIGQYQCELGIKCLAVLSTFFAGVSCLFFGILAKFDNDSSFLMYSILLRIVQAISFSSVATSVLTILQCVAENHFETVLALNQAVGSLGYTISPVFGGYLYDIGGFYLPFTVIGAPLIFLSILVCALLTTDVTPQSRKCTKPSYKTVLTKKEVWLSLTVNTVGASGYGFLLSILELHLGPMQLSALMVGSMFFNSSVCYSMTSQLCCLLCDRGLPPTFFLLIGDVLVCVCFALLGPISESYGDLNFWIIFSAMLINGVGCGSQFIPSLIHMKKHCMGIGQMECYGIRDLVARTWLASINFGSMLGPYVGGNLYQHFGFSYTCILIIALNALHAVATGLCMLSSCVKAIKRPGEVCQEVLEAKSETRQ